MKMYSLIYFYVKQFSEYLTLLSIGNHVDWKVKVFVSFFTNRYPACKAWMAMNKSGQGKMQFERWLKDKKVPEYMTMRLRKEIVDSEKKKT